MITLAIPLSIAEQAVCGQTDPELFFPEKGGSVREPKLICGVCPVREECLDWALDNDVRHGVWGGHSDRERRRILRNRADTELRPAAETPAPTPTPRKKRPAAVAACGTRPGYQRHRKNGEQACDACRQANTDADNRLRRTGTSKVAA